MIRVSGLLTSAFHKTFYSFCLSKELDEKKRIGIFLLHKELVEKKKVKFLAA